MAKKVVLTDDETTDFVPSRPSQRKVAKVAVKAKKKAAAVQRPPWARRHKWSILVSCFVLCILIVVGITMKLRADFGGRNYHANALTYLDSADTIIASHATPRETSTAFGRLEVPKFDSVFAAEKYSTDYKRAMNDKKLVESIQGGIAAQLVEYSMLADFEAHYQKELAAVADLHDGEPVSIDQAPDWVKQYQVQVSAMQTTVKNSQVPPEVQGAKDALRDSLVSASSALKDVASAADLGRVDTYNDAFDKLTVAENKAAEAYATIQSIEPDATQTTLLTKIQDAKKRL